MTEIDRIHCGDCLDGMKDIDDGSIDAIISDLPYGTTANRWDSILPLDVMWAGFKRISKPGAPIVLFSQQPFTTTLAASNLPWLRTEWIWRKNSGTGWLNAKKYPLKNHENILVFCSQLPPYNPQMTARKPYVRKRRGEGTPNYRKSLSAVDTINTTGERYPQTVLDFKIERGHHPTQKPVALLEYLVLTYTVPGALIFDPCIGSGTTALAAIRTGRHFLGFERDQTYWETTQKRIVAAQHGPTEKLTAEKVSHPFSLFPDIAVAKSL